MPSLFVSTSLVAALILFAGTTLSVSAAGDDAAVELARLFRDYDEWEREQWPEWSLARGDDRWADRIADQSLEAIERRHAEEKVFLARLRAIEREALADPDDRLNHDLFALQREQSIAGHRFRRFLAPVSGRNGPHQSVPQMAERVPFERRADFENYLARLEQVPGMLTAHEERMRLGMAEGRLPARVTVEPVPAQLRAVLEGGGLGRLRTPLAEPPPAVEAAIGPDLRRRYDERIEPALRDALRRFRRFLSEEYLPACPDVFAASAWPDGRAFYDHRLRVFTTTDLTAAEIHAIGLAEVARIRGEMMEVIAGSDFLERRPEAADLDDEARFAAFLDYLRTDPRFYFRTEGELLARYRDICKQADGWMPRFFGRLPRLPYGVREIPRFMAPAQTTAYYMPGSLERGEPGWFYANTYALDQRPTYEMTALALHEAVPGHHHQIALAQEMEAGPEFRKNMRVTAFVEGWALYAERLGTPMGLYEDPYDDFGRLLYEMWRACRLVVDPGMHALGWSRQEAIDFMRANTALSELNITTEVDRYIAWPGQATAYKIGELRIRELRADAEDRLGEAFDLRAWHDHLLGAGALPLSVLETRMDAWVAGVAKVGDETGPPSVGGPGE